MKYITIENLKASRIILGCMRFSKLSSIEVERLIIKALDLGINYFDHADIYGAGKCEELFGEVLRRNPSLREKIIIQSKCGIRNGFYDSSKEHILSSVEASLKRLNTEYLDVLLIHRPDALMDLEEINEAFSILYNEGKVRYFGVSNMNSMQIELLQRNIDHKIIFNQMQLSVVHSHMIDSSFNVNMNNSYSINRDESILDYSRLNSITVQAWSALMASWEEGSFLDHPNYVKLNEKLSYLGEKYFVSPSAVAINWILRHPSSIQAIVGTTSLIHLEELVKATSFELTRQEWYEIYSASGKKLP